MASLRVALSMSRYPILATCLATASGPARSGACGASGFGRGGACEALQQPGGGGLESVRVAVGSCDQHCPLETADERLGGVAGRAVEHDRAVRLAFLEDGGEPALVVVEEADHLLAHRFGQRLVIGRQHAAQAHALLVQDIRVDAGVCVELGRRVATGGVDSLECGGEAGGVALDERPAELRLAGKVVVQAGFGDAQLSGDVGVAEALEAAALDEPLRAVEDPRGSVRVVSLALGWHEVLTAYLLVDQTGFWTCWTATQEEARWPTGTRPSTRASERPTRRASSPTASPRSSTSAGGRAGGSSSSPAGGGATKGRRTPAPPV